MNEQNEDTFLAKWLNNELDQERLTNFEQTEEFKEFNKIIEAVDNAVVPEYDIDKNFEATLKKIQQEKEKNPPKKEVKVKRLIPSWAYAVASCVLIFVGYMYFFNETTHVTKIAQKQEISLPDGSTVFLNADSKISYKTYRFNSDKTINLSGEALFKVQKGNTFSVSTQQGTVTVLGTTFSVTDRNTLYKVICFEGKVAVNSIKDKNIKLSKGEGYLLKNNNSKTYETPQKEPTWVHNESVFTATDIADVIAELERQYTVTITGKEHLKPAEFSGRFTHNDINKAIKTVFSAMQIPYKIKDKNTIVIQKY